MEQRISTYGSPHDNPAKRLLGILVEGKKEDPHLKCREVWVRLLDIKSDNDALLISRISKVIGLIQLTVSELKKLDDTDEDSSQHWESKVTEAFIKQNIETTWHSFIIHIDQPTISLLKLSAQLLKQHLTISEFSDDQLEKLKLNVEELMEFVLSSNIDVEIQLILLRSFDRILNSINEYKITGHSVIFDELDSIMGKNFTNEKFQKEMKTEDGSKILSRLNIFSNMLSVYNGVPELAQDAFKFFITDAQ